jgi:putative transposase
MGHWLTVGLAEQALTMALANQDPLAKLLHHSVFGSQYAAARYQLMLTTHGMTINMSKRGRCYDNACVESFFEMLKHEIVYHRHYATR